MSHSFGTKSGSLESLKRRTRCGAKPCARQMRWTEETLMPAALAIAAPVQWVASCGGSVAVRATTLSMTSWPSGGTRGGRVLSRNRPSTPSAAKRSCQRQTQVFDLPVRRTRAFFPLLRVPLLLAHTLEDCSQAIPPPPSQHLGTLPPSLQPATFS